MTNRAVGFLILLATVLAGGCGRLDNPPLGAAIRELAVDSGAAGPDLVTDFDAKTDTGGGTHLAWVIQRQPRRAGALPRFEIWTAHQGAAESPWSPPQEVVTGIPGPVRLGRDGDEMWLVAGRSLAAFRFDCTYSRWSPAGNLGGGDQDPIAAFAAVGNAEEFEVVAVIQPQAPRGGAVAGAHLSWYRVSGFDSVAAIASPPLRIDASGQVEIAAISWRGSVVVIVAGPDLGSADRSSHARRDRIYHVALNRATARWSDPVPLPTANSARPLHIGELALTAGGELVLGYRDPGVVITATPDLKHWREPVRLARHAPGGAQHFGSRSLAVNARSDQVFVSWIDARNQKSDRSLLNPTGGFPWGDDTEWSNNDLFSAVVALGPRPRVISIAPLTYAGGFVRTVLPLSRGIKSAVLWCGQTETGKRLSESSGPIRFFTATLN